MSSHITLSVTAFQVALNHDDPAVVTSGLLEFEAAILQQHGATEHFGYIGRSTFSDLAGYAPTNAMIAPEYPSSIVGLLQSYLVSSPDLEELFILWDLPGRNEDKRLSSQHMRCFAAILFCAHNDDQMCRRIESRILRDYPKSIQRQLTSGNSGLVHSTLGLLLSLCRVSDQSCRDVYSKLLIISFPVLSTLSQKGKELSHTCLGIGDTSSKIHTDARFFVILIVLRCIQAANTAILNELLSEKSILRALISSLHTDGRFAVQVFLDCLLSLLPGPALHKLFETRFQQKLLSMYENPIPEVQTAAHRFLMEICLKIADSNVAAGRSVFGQLMKQLNSLVDIRHNEIQTLALKHCPALLPKCVAAIPAPAPKSVFQLASLFENLYQIYTHTDIDGSLRLFMRSVCTGNKSDDEVREFLRVSISNLLPPWLTKKDLTKFLSHSNVIVLRLVMETLAALINRIHRMISDAGKQQRKLEAFLSNVLLNHIPDIHTILAVRSRFLKSELNPDMIDEKTHSVLYSNLKVIHGFILIIPNEFARVGFDALRLLDDLVPWELTSSASAVASRSSDINVQITSLTLKILKLVTSLSIANWFGTRDDTVKSLTQIIFSSCWSEVIKRSALSKLMILARSNAVYSIEADKLLKQILVQSGMFYGHGILNFDFNLQRNIFQECISLGDNSMLLFDIVLRISFHWNIEICHLLSEKLSTYSEYGISPALLVAVHLSTRQFDSFGSDLPSHIRQHLSEDSYFEKYNIGFRKEIQQLTIHVITTVSTFLISSQNFIVAVQVLSTGAGAGNEVFNLIKDLSLLMSSEPVDAMSREVIFDTRMLSPSLILYFCCSEIADFTILKNISLSFIIRVCLRKGIALSPNLIIAFKKQIAENTSSVEAGGLSLDDLIRFLIQALNLFMEFSQLNSIKFSNSDRKSSRKRVASEPIFLDFQQLLSILTRYIVDVIKAISGAGAGIEALQATSLHEYISGDNSFSSHCRLILRAAALTYARRAVVDSKKRVNQTITNSGSISARTISDSYFEMMADRIISDKKSAHVEYFSFLWIFQSFLTDSPKLKAAIASIALELKDGWLFLNIDPINSRLSAVQPLIETSHVQSLSGSILRDAELSSLRKARASLINAENSYDTPRSNLLDGVSVILDKNCSLSFYFHARNIFQESNSDIQTDIVSRRRSQWTDGMLTLFPLEISRWRVHLKGYLEAYAACISKISLEITMNYFEESKFDKDDWSFVSCYIQPSLRCFGDLNTPETVKVSLAISLLSSIPRARVGPFLRFALQPLIIFYLVRVGDRIPLDPNWLHVVQDVLLYYLEDFGNSLKRLKLDVQPLPGVIDDVLISFDIVVDFMYLSSSASFEPLASCKSLRSNKISEKLNRAVKYALRLGFISDIATRVIDNIFDLYISQESLTLFPSNRVGSEDFLNPLYLFRLFTGHSEFRKLAVAKNSNSELFRTLLRILNIVFYSKNSDAFVIDELKREEVNEFVDLLLVIYSGTLSISDRLILRILTILNVNGFCPPLSTLHLKSFRSSDRKDLSWIFNAMSPPIVYSTLGSFPFDRSIILRPFDFESDGAMNATRATLTDYYSQFDPVLSDESNQSNFGSNSGLQFDKFSSWSSRSLVNETLYDPAYWIPALLHCLSKENPPIREIANSGLFSILLATLGSSCAILRAYSTACMQKISQCLLSKSAEKDTAFKERPQLLMLTYFLRNSIDKEAINLTNLHFNPSSCIFFGRAALHLLQSTHEMFGKVNKYLLAKPFYDAKDIPLFDLVIMNGDIQTESGEMLSVLRFIRDGLVSKDDHLNMCRKNAYIHLMVRFPQFLKDIKLAHATLDIFDRALNIEAGARYLFERCVLVSWLNHLISVAAMNQEHYFQAKKSYENVRSVEFNEDFRSKGDKGTNFAPPAARIFGRVFQLLRKCIIADKLLSINGNKSVYSELHTVISAIIDDFLQTDDRSLSYLGADSIRNFLNFIWDCSLAGVLNGPSFVWGVDKLISFAYFLKDNSIIYPHKIEQDYCVLQILFTIALIPATELSCPSASLISAARLLESVILRIFLSTPEDKIDQILYLTFATQSSKKLCSQASIYNILSIAFISHEDNLVNKWSYLETFTFDDYKDSFMSFGTAEFVTLSSLTLLKLYSGVDEQIISNHLPTIRLLLVMQEAYRSVDLSDFELENMSKLLSVLDRSDQSLYSREFCRFQTSFRISLLTAYLFVHTISNSNTSMSFILRGINKSIYCLLQFSSRHKMLSKFSLDNFPMSLREIQRRHLSDGHDLWADIEYRKKSSDLCDLVLELVSVVVSLLERSTVESNEVRFAEINETFGFLLREIDCLCETFSNGTTFVDYAFGRPDVRTSLSDTLNTLEWTEVENITENDLSELKYSSKKRNFREIYSHTYLSTSLRNTRLRPVLSMKDVSSTPLLSQWASTSTSNVSSELDSKFNIGSGDSFSVVQGNFSGPEAEVEHGDINLNDLLQKIDREYPAIYHPLHKFSFGSLFAGKTTSKRKLSYKVRFSGASS